jgi:hypothetical protein
LCDGIEDLVAECGLTVNVLQGREDGNDLVATAGIERNVGDGGGTESKLGIEGAAHGESLSKNGPLGRRNSAETGIFTGLIRKIPAIFGEKISRRPRKN